ncbi:hypothetical protein EYF80_044641 [Liparis tanakae]|uniref:Uncharacterized protein n=1 Tax=Liparis tanakae TaxID=230148 RepID=A0A4Z2FW80_9TELE|nr:hypothetical protein EYF80_044641 [Liparis tanakae]
METSTIHQADGGREEWAESQQGDKSVSFVRKNISCDLCSGKLDKDNHSYIEVARDVFMSHQSWSGALGRQLDGHKVKISMAAHKKSKVKELFRSDSSEAERWTEMRAYYRMVQEGRNIA